MQFQITKIQILTDRALGNPLYYCHAEDLGHEPVISIAIEGDKVKFYSHSLYKVKKRNPQTKKRLDIYIPIPVANQIGYYLKNLAPQSKPWKVSSANPNANISGNMALPKILYSCEGRCILARAKTDSEVKLEANKPRVFIEIEEPHSTHIKMKSKELHIGIPFQNQEGIHNNNMTWPVEVPITELQRGANEENPVYKVMGTMYLEMEIKEAAGMGLSIIEAIRMSESN